MPYDAVGIADVGEAKDFTQMQDDTSRERRMVFIGKTYRLTLTRRMNLTLAEIGIHVLTVSYLLIIQILLTIPRLVYIQ